MRVSLHVYCTSLAFVTKVASVVKKEHGRVRLPLSLVSYGRSKIPNGHIWVTLRAINLSAPWHISCDASMYPRLQSPIQTDLRLYCGCPDQILVEIAKWIQKYCDTARWSTYDVYSGESHEWLRACVVCDRLSISSPFNPLSAPVHMLITSVLSYTRHNGIVICRLHPKCEHLDWKKDFKNKYFTARYT